MMHLSELKRLHRRNNTNTRQRNLQTFIEARKVSPRQVLLPYCKEYCDTSSIHCMHYLTNAKMQNFEKTIWFLIIVATTFGAVFVYFELAELYSSHRMETTVANSVHPVFYIPFPSVGICTRNRVDWPKLQDAQKRFLHANASDETQNTFRQFFERLEDLRFDRFSQLAPLFENQTKATRTPFFDIDDVDMVEVMEYLSFNCADIFADLCLWRKKSYNCCELFTLERTEVGFCHVFNSAVGPKAQERVKQDKYYPFHNSKSGENSGLNVVIKLDESKMRPGFNSTNGVYVMIKQPEAWHNDVRFIASNTITKIGITAQLTETDKSARSVTPEERSCIFQDENNHPMYKKIPGLKYWMGNCRTRCHQEYVVRLCNCTPSLLFPKPTLSDNFTDCIPSDFKCIYEHRHIFSAEHHVLEYDFIDDVGGSDSGSGSSNVSTGGTGAGMVCNCLNNCNQLLFDYSCTSVPLEGINASESIKQVHLDVHFQTYYILKYNTRMRFTFVELLASFGGIIGLFLGASLLSAVELGYYMTVGLYMHWRKQYGLRNSKNQVKVINVHSNSNLFKNNKF